MKKSTIRAALLALVAAMSATAAGCTYSTMTAINENTVVIATDGLFGIGGTVYVCKVSDAGLVSCQENISP